LQHFPVDDITEKTACALHIPAGNLTTRVAFTVVSPVEDPEPAVIHGNQIRAGYARVGVDRVEKDYMELDVEIPGGDGEMTLGQAEHAFILWYKRYIIIPDAPRLPSPPPPQQPHHRCG